MKKQSKLYTFDIPSVDSLETYLFHLGMMLVSLESLVTLQNKAESLGIFNEDETEASKTIRYQHTRLIICAQDLLTMVSSRVDMDLDAMKQKIAEVAKQYVARKPPKRKK